MANLLEAAQRVLASTADTNEALVALRNYVTPESITLLRANDPGIYTLLSDIRPMIQAGDIRQAGIAAHRVIGYFEGKAEQERIAAEAGTAGQGLKRADETQAQFEARLWAERNIGKPGAAPAPQAALIDGETRDEAIVRLDLPRDATDADIAKAHAEALRAAPLETDAERDARLRAEYPMRTGETGVEYDARIARGGV